MSSNTSAFRRKWQSICYKSTERRHIIIHTQKSLKILVVPECKTLACLQSVYNYNGLSNKCDLVNTLPNKTSHWTRPSDVGISPSIDSGGARVFAARGKCHCCRPHRSDQFCNQGNFQDFEHGMWTKPWWSPLLPFPHFLPFPSYPLLTFPFPIVFLFFP